MPINIGEANAVTADSATIFSNKVISGIDNTLVNIPLSAFDLSDIVVEFITSQTTDGTIPSAKLVQESLNLKADQSTLVAHTGSTSNPHSVTKSQVGLGEVQNTKVNLTATSAPAVSDDSASGYSIGSVWVNVTTKIAYKCVDATIGAAVWVRSTFSSTANLPEDPSNLYYTTARANSDFDTRLATKSTANLAEGVGALYYTDVRVSANSDVAANTSHRNNVANPHNVTATQVGLGNVTNESKATMFASPTFTGTVGGITPTMVGLGNVPNVDATSPANITQSASYRFVSDTEKSIWNGKQDALGFTAVPNSRTVNGHALTADISVTAGDVGLGNVSNTAPADLPISTATQTALNLKETIAGAKKQAIKMAIIFGG